MAYAPSGSNTTTASLAHLATVYYERKGLDRLTAHFHMAELCVPKSLPLNSGQTIQWFRFDLPAINVAAAPEGVIGSPVPQTSRIISATVQQYSDFMSSSSLLEETDINESTINQMVEDLSYRAASSVDTIIRQEVDSNAAAQVATLGANLVAGDFKANVALLKGVNVNPFDDGNFLTVLHPFVTYDVISDNTAGGFIDASKYQNGVAVLNGEVGKVGGCRLMESTNVGNDGVAPPARKYFTYIVGKGALGIVDLAGKGPDRVIDPANERFRTAIVKGGPSAADPVGEIGTYVSYRFVFAAKTLNALCLKIVKSDASLV